VSDSYLALIRRFPLRPIRSDAELDRAIAVVDSLVDRDRLDRGESDYLDVLSDLVERYEEEHHPIAPASDAAMLEHLMDSRDVTQLAVAEATGIVNSTLSAVLSGKRRLTRDHIARLAAYFQVGPTVFAFEADEPGNGKGRR
jgi:HTH-type transcriptional regulator/antitoxin HigA